MELSPSFTPGPVGLSRLKITVLLLILQAVGLGISGWFGFSAYPSAHGADHRLYVASADRVVQGQLPYRDFEIEYPPLGLLPLVAPRLLGAKSDEGYRRLLLLEMMIFSTVIALSVSQCARHLPRPVAGHRPLIVYAIAITTLGWFVPWRFDLFPAVFTGLATLAFLAGRPGTCGALLGLGVAAKLYPLVLAPIFSAERLARRDRKSTGRFVLALCVTTLATMLPFAIMGGAGFFRTFAYHADRGLEIGSVASGLGLLGHLSGLSPASTASRYGSIELDFPGSASILRLLPVAAVMGLASVSLLAYLRFRRDVNTGMPTGPTLVGCLTLILLVFAITNKVLSPQYLVWFLPFCPLLPLRHALTFVAGCVLTTWLFPAQFVELMSLQGFAILLLNTRNALLVGAAVWLTRDLRVRS